MAEELEGCCVRLRSDGVRRVHVSLLVQQRLQRKVIALVQYFHHHNGVPTVHRIRRLKIVVYGREHGRPHFPVLGPDGEAVVTIETLEVLVGELPRAAAEEVLEWARANHATLMSEWNKRR